jgi:predicted dehydrogenase
LLKGAIVGFGEVARYGHWPAYAGSDAFTIVAVVDRSEVRRTLARSLSSEVHVYPSIDALVAAGERVDFVDICTPPALHADPIGVALDRRWHVVCEKPFVLDSAVLAIVRERAVAAALAVVPVHNWKCAPIVREATLRLRRGDIGRLESVEIETERLKDFTGADPSRPNWRRDPAIAGGGILMDHGWHAVYLTLTWFGARPSDVACTCHRPEAGAVEDEAELRLAFPRGAASIRLTWNGRVRRNTMRLEGDEGVITIADDRLIVVRGSRTEETVFQPALSAGSHHEDWFAAFLPSLAACFNEPRSSRELFDEAAACLDIIRAGYASADHDFATRS